MGELAFLDELDKNIIQEMSKGVNSYEELARKCRVTRSTIYRRINIMEKNNIVMNQIRMAVNFEKLDLVVVLLGLNVTNENMEKVIGILMEHECVKMIWRTFGAYNLSVIIFCGKGDEGKRIYEMRDIFEKLHVNSFEVAVGFGWEKMDMTPF